MACHAEGEAWELNGAHDMEYDVTPCKDGGSMRIKPKNVWDFKLKNFNEHITGKRPELFIWNLAPGIGKTDAQRVGLREFKNHTNGDYAILEILNPKFVKDRPEGSFEGKIYNSKDEAMYEIFGNFYDNMVLKDVKTQ